MGSLASHVDTLNVLKNDAALFWIFLDKIRDENTMALDFGLRFLTNTALRPSLMASPTIDLLSFNVPTDVMSIIREHHNNPQLKALAHYIISTDLKRIGRLKSLNISDEYIFGNLAGPLFSARSILFNQPEIAKEVIVAKNKPSERESISNV